MIDLNYYKIPESLDGLEKRFSAGSLISSDGAFSVVYNVFDRSANIFAGKYLHHDRFGNFVGGKNSLPTLFRSDRISKDLQEIGLPVVKSFGVYDVHFSWLGKYFPSNVQEKISGSKKVSDLSKEKREYYLNEAKKYLDLAKSEGYTPGHDALRPGNLLINQEGLKFLDFDLWLFPGEGSDDERILFEKLGFL